MSSEDVDIVANMTDTDTFTAASVGKGPRTRKPRRRRRMLTGVSRQRRAANARERRRIQGVNDAFLELKNKIPVLKPEDVSKMETLRLAAKWIAHLTTVLIQDDRNRKQDSKHKALPTQLQAQLEDLLQFELEDFMLISNSFNSENVTPAPACDRPCSDKCVPYSSELSCESFSNSSSDLPYSSSELPHLDSCEFYSQYSGSSPDSLSEDHGLSLAPYDFDLPPLVSVFSQQSSCSRDLYNFSVNQFEGLPTVAPGFYR